MSQQLLPQLSDVTEETRRAKRVLDYIVAFRWLAAVGALSAAVAPAVMATADGSTLRGSVSAYWNVDPSFTFWLPFTAAALLLAGDGIISYLSPNKKEFGGRFYNVVLGVSLVLLTWFNVDEQPNVHYPAAVVFFGLFICVIVYTSTLGWAGIHIEGAGDHDTAIERAGAQVSVVFLGLLAITGIAWVFGLISFFFFEIFALLNFAIYHVQGSLHAFPYNHYEFPIPILNTIFRALRIMR